MTDIKCRDCCERPLLSPVAVTFAGGTSYYAPDRYVLCEYCSFNHVFYKRVPIRDDLDQYGVFTYWHGEERFMKLSDLEELLEKTGGEPSAPLSFCRNGIVWDTQMPTVDTMDALKGMLDDELPFTLVPTEAWEKREREEITLQEESLKRRRTELDQIKF